MLDRRQRKLRRAVTGGIVLAMLAVLPIALIEVIYLFVAYRPGLTMGQALGFTAAAILIPLGIAPVVGAAEGLLFLAVSELTSKLAKQRLAEPRWMSLIYCVLLLPPIALLIARMFSGRWISQAPYRDLIAAGSGLLLLGLAYVALRMIIGARDRFRLRRWESRAALLLISLLLVLCAGLYVADQRLLPGLYPAFHVTLMLGMVACSQLAVATAYATFRARRRWVGKLIEPNRVLIAALVITAIGAISLRSLCRSPTMTFVAHRYAAFQGKLLRMARHFGIKQPEPTKHAAATASRAVFRSKLAPPQAPDHNIVLVTVDALRADHLGTYGYKRKTTPNIDRWAKSAVVFERGYCPVPHTSFSLTSIHTGMNALSMPSAQPRTLAAALRRYGYKTAAFFPPAVFYIDKDRFAAFRHSKFDFEYVKFEFIAADKRVDQFVQFLDSYPKRKFMAWLHFFEPHEPYERQASTDFGDRAIDRYDSEVAYVDRAFGKLVEEIKRRRPNTVIALTADHGEAFGEHNSHYHGNTLYEEQIRVPLIISAPTLAARRVDGPAQTIDLAPTLLALADVPVPATMTGNDLGPWLVGEQPKHLPPARISLEQKKAVVDGHSKLIYDHALGYGELYDLVRDPGEANNRFASDAPKAAAMRALLSPRKVRARRTDIAALLARAERRDPETIPALLELYDRRPRLRRAALRLLVRLRTRAAQSRLKLAVSNPDPGISIQAAVGLALLGDKKQLTALRPLLARPDLPPTLRKDALIALARSGAKEHVLELAQTLERTADVYDRIELIETLGKVGDPRSSKALIGQLKALRTRRYAIDALGDVGGVEAVAKLARALVEDNFISWRTASAAALGKIGDRRALPALWHALRFDTELSVVQEALVALAKFSELSKAKQHGIQTLRANWQCNAKQADCRWELANACGAARELLLLGPQGDPAATIRAGCSRDGAAPTALSQISAEHHGLTLSLRGTPATLVIQANRPTELAFVGIRLQPVASARRRPGTSD
ncbi:MAG: sulfatase-like hydrolase/transferase [Deltaproteobacteria bacterium]|nr:sulfatase-like hydrolase/transferase [Deltaproteobacteria bacterium]